MQSYITILFLSLANVAITKAYSYMETNQERFKIQTPKSYLSQKVNPQSAKFITIDGKEREWLSSLYAQEVDFISSYLPRIRIPTLHDFDLAYGIWKTGKKHSKQQVIIALGSALGTQCNKNLNTEWVKIVLGEEVDYTIMSANRDAFICPFTDIEKLINFDTQGFLSMIYNNFDQDLKSQCSK
jgi:hypothetical protein